jgi:hypothetical protein
MGIDGLLHGRAGLNAPDFRAFMPYYPITYTNLLNFLIVTYIVTLVYVYKIGLRRNRIIRHITPQFRRFLAKTGVNQVLIGSAIGARRETRRKPLASCNATQLQSDNKCNRTIAA